VAVAVERLGFVPGTRRAGAHGASIEERVWTRGDLVLRVSERWLELSAPDAIRPAGVETLFAGDGVTRRWTKAFTDPRFGAFDPWRRLAPGVLAAELPPPILDERPEADELVELLAWSLRHAPSEEGDTGVRIDGASRRARGDVAPAEAASILPASALVVQQGPIVRQGRIVLDADVARIGFPVLQSSVAAIPSHRHAPLATLLSDASRRWRWIRLGVDEERRPAVEIAVPATSAALATRVALLARDALAAFLAWIAPAAEFVVTGEAVCLDDVRSWIDEPGASGSVT
jgi:hypothetical protein